MCTVLWDVTLCSLVDVYSLVGRDSVVWYMCTVLWDLTLCILVEVYSVVGCDTV